MSGVGGGTRQPRLGDVVTRVVTGCLGAGMILLPAPHLTGHSRALVVIGLVLVAVSLPGPLASWRFVGTLAAATAIAESTLARPDLAVLAWEGLLILGYLLLVDAPRAMPWTVTARWLWRQLPLAVWGVFTAAIVLVVLAVRVPVSAWLLVAGAGAAVAAVVIALPRRPPEPREPR
ncbi:MAG: hypothetical protein ACTHPS_04390 [Streptosporangiaceae bacterium]